MREALIEREVLLGRRRRTSSGRCASCCRITRGLRPAWLLRLGLFLYDHLGGRKLLPPTRTLDLATTRPAQPLKREFTRGFEYSDCWVDDARLVVLNARDAADARRRDPRRARDASRERDGAALAADARAQRKRRGATVRGAGAGQRRRPLGRRGAQRRRRHATRPAAVRLVQGSHIVVRQALRPRPRYIFQNADGRIVFAIPYERDFTLIGTTDRDYQGRPRAACAIDRGGDRLSLAAVERLFRDAGDARRMSSGPIPACGRSTTTAPARRRRRRATTC